MAEVSDVFVFFVVMLCAHDSITRCVLLLKSTHKSFKNNPKSNKKTPKQNLKKNLQLKIGTKLPPHQLFTANVISV